MANETKRERWDKRLGELRALREPIMPEWREIAENFYPRTLPWLMDRGKQNTRNRRNTKIINTTPVMAARTLTAGMMSGATSPARPWFRLVTPDPEMMEFAPVKLWLYQVQRTLSDVFARSNFYNSLAMGYGELGRFGTLSLGMFEDGAETLRCWTYPAGGYSIANSSRGTVDSVYVEYTRTVRQIVQEFGLKPNRSIDWSRISATVRERYDRNQLEQPFQLVHVVEPNEDRDPRYADNQNMPVRSCYYEVEQKSKDVLLRESGFNEMPILVSRWDVVGEDPWGTGPGLDALGDAKALQYRERQKAKRIDKHNDPALVGHPDLKNKRVSLLPGDVTYVGFTPTGGAPQLQPVHTVNHDINSLLVDIEAIEGRVRRAMYEDLFLMLAMSDRRDITATEVAERHEEKLLVLGPVLERQNNELLNPAIDRNFGICLRAGKFPPPPQELEGAQLRVEYVSLLAQAQRMVATGSIERFANFIGALATAQANAAAGGVTVMDKLDFDQAADEYAEALGVPPTIVRSDDQVEDIRAQRDKQARMQQMAAAAQPMAQAAKAAKDLSETQLRGKPALDQVADAAAATLQ